MYNPEYFPIVNEQGDVAGKAIRTDCHNGSYWLHPVVHLHVFNTMGQLYLQKRSMDKDTQPGKWDTSVGGHVHYGEKIEDALWRETDEELSIQVFEPIFIKRYILSSDEEKELVHTYYCIYDGPIYPDASEITEGRFWEKQEIDSLLNTGLFTTNFEYEFIHIIKDSF